MRQSLRLGRVAGIPVGTRCTVAVILVIITEMLGVSELPAMVSHEPAVVYWAVATGAALAGFLAGSPTAAVAAGQWAYTTGVRAEHAQQADWHQVPAMLLETAPTQAGTAYGSLPRIQVQARWTAPDGTPRTGRITVAAGTAAGSTVLVWIDASGRLQSPLHGTVIALAVAAAVWVPLLVGLLLFGTWRLARRSLDRQRLTAWEADWSLTGPRWTSRR